MLKLPAALALIAALAAPAAAHADAFNFTITTPGNTFSAVGTLSGPADPFAPGAFVINSVSGTAYGFALSGPVLGSATNSHTTATSNGFTYDNVLYTAAGAPHVDSNGILLLLNGTSLASVYYNNGYFVNVVDPGDPGDVTPFSISGFVVTPVAATPEPSALALLGTGALTLVGFGRRRLRR